MADRLDESDPEDISFVGKIKTGSKESGTRKSRVSKEKGQKLSKSIFETENAEKDDLSEEHSDYEEELKKQRHKDGRYSSEEDHIEDQEICEKKR